MHGKHEYNKRFCENREQNRAVDHLCYLRPMKDTLPTAGDKVFYVFYDFETIQTTRYADKATLHAPNFVCVQQFCAQAGKVEDGYCVRCGKRKQ